MRDLARSMIRLPWALPLMGTAQLADVLRRRAGLERLGSSLEVAAWTGHRRLDLGSQALLQAGNDLSREWLDSFFDAMDPRSPSAAAAALAKGLAAVARSSGETLRIATPGQAGEMARQELRNKLEVYFLVRGVRERLRLPPAGQAFELDLYVERALAHDSYRALWLIEGLGHDYTEQRLALGNDPTGLLEKARAPPSALLMLHAGLGLALAEHVLGEMRPGDPEAADVERAIDRFVTLARSNSRSGFADAALESLGLVARCFFPDLVVPIDRALAGSDGPLQAYFWHGVGRAIYFVPINFVPGYGSIGHALDMARRQAPDEGARRHAVAGVAYAVALVNLSHPGIVEHLLRSRGESLRDGAFTEGLISSIVMRLTTTPDDPGLATFLHHRPADAHLAGLWHALITEPLQEAMGGFESGEGSAEDERGEVYRALTDPSEFEGLTRPAASVDSGETPG